MALNRWFQLEEPDIYRVTGIWELHLEDPAGGRFGQGLWDDLVSAECFVRVEKGKT